MFPNHRYLPSIILTTILIISIHIPTSHSHCTNLFHCGESIKGIGYPFYGQDRPALCGLEGFELKCQDNENITTIEISSQTFQVLGIDQNNHSMTLARSDLLDDVCPERFNDTPMNDTLFSYVSGTVRFLNLYYSCPFGGNQIPDRNRTTCSTKGGGDTINWSNEELRRCHNVTVPVVSMAAEEFIRESGNISLKGLLEEGFPVQYKFDVAACDACERSGGWCWQGTNTSTPSCVCEGEQVNYGACPGRKKSHGWMYATIGAATGFIFLVVFVMFFYLCQRRKRYAGSTHFSRSVSSYPSSTRDIEKTGIYQGVQIFKYNELKKATRHFDPNNELGDGGFGTVYQGKLKDGRTVAVKRLYENNYKRVEQFMNEVEILARLRHQHLVSLYGCTTHHDRELLLVYEFVPNGTVADHLHGEHAKPSLLTWTTRMNIAIETADALAYLHASEVIHRDVKTNNILLDNNFGVKVADFGLSRLFPLNVTHLSTAPQGTPGYVDPEYHECYHLTCKSDVFSFGVVLIELISSKPAVDITRHRHEINLSNMAINKIRNGTLEELVDPSLGYETDNTLRKMINSVAELAFQCLQSKREMRPTMEQVLEVLRGIQSEDKERRNLEDLEISRDDAALLKDNPPVLSPDSVAVKWNSTSSTTSNPSG